MWTQVLAAWRDRATDDSLDDNLVREYLALKVNKGKRAVRGGRRAEGGGFRSLY